MNDEATSGSEAILGLNLYRVLKILSISFLFSLLSPGREVKHVLFILSFFNRLL